MARLPEPDLFLNAAELFTLTGRRQKKAQVQWLRDHGHGIRWWQNGAGNPVVPRSNFEVHPEPSPAPAARGWTPNVLKHRNAAA